MACPQLSPSPSKLPECREEPLAATGSIRGRIRSVAIPSRRGVASFVLLRRSVPESSWWWRQTLDRAIAPHSHVRGVPERRSPGCRRHRLRLWPRRREPAARTSGGAFLRTRTTVRVPHQSPPRERLLAGQDNSSAMTESPRSVIAGSVRVGAVTASLRRPVGSDCSQRSGAGRAAPIPSWSDI
jgi:hypothetical protein